MSNTDQVASSSIRPPMTTGDRGDPSKSILKDTERIFALIDDERHLVAHRLYKSVIRRIEESEDKEPVKKKRSGKLKAFIVKDGSSLSKGQEELNRAKNILNENEPRLTKLENVSRIFTRALRNLNTDEDWTFASLHFGITTYYRREDDGSLSVKLEGELSGVPLFEQIAVIRAADLHYKWVPFCSSSILIAELDKLDIVEWFMIGIPQLGFARDGCFRAIGCDNMSEDGSIIISGQGLYDIMPGEHPPKDPFLSDDPVISTLNIPPVPTKRGNGRLTIRKFETIVNVTSPTSAKTRVVVNLNPNISFLSQGIIDFALKHLAGVILGKLQSAAKKAVKNPATNHHAQKMREESAFYQWLMEKFQAFCDEKEWEMPRVAAFTVNEEQLQHNRRYTDRKTRKLNTFGGHDSFASDRLDFTSIESARNMNRDQADDSVSDITAKSSMSLWQKNPVSSYMQAVKARKILEEEARIAEVRQRVTNLMKPKQLSYEQQDRLDQLRVAKQRRVAEIGSVSAESSVATGTASISSKETLQHLSLIQRVTLQLYKHGKWTRLFVLTFFVVLLFVLLHTELLMNVFLERVLLSRPDGPIVEWSRDLVTILYILQCTLVHSCLCDVSLVYTFSSLELGSKTGQQIRGFYGTKVRVGVLALSIGIAVFSAAKPTLRIFLYFLFWIAFQMSSMVLTSLTAVLDKIEYFLSTTNNEVAAFALVLLHCFRKHSNLTSEQFDTFLFHIPICDDKLGFLGEIVETTYDAALSRLSLISKFLLYGSMNEKSWNAHVSWRHDVISTSKVLFSNSAVFLVTVLFIFILTTPKTRRGGSKSPLHKSGVGDENTLERHPVDTATTSSSTKSLKVPKIQKKSVPVSVNGIRGKPSGRDHLQKYQDHLQKYQQSRPSKAMA